MLRGMFIMKNRNHVKSKVQVILFAALLSNLFLLGSGIAAVQISDNVIKDPDEVPPAVYPRNTTTIVSVDLVVKEVIAEIAPGKRFWFWTFNGTVPGPMIRVMEGDTVIINLTSEPSNMKTHNIDLHAAMGPGGGSFVTNAGPGGSATLRFKAMRPGAYIYHCAGEGLPWEHVSHGLYGLIMVEPKGGLTPADKEFYIGQSDWYLKARPRLESKINPQVSFYDLDRMTALSEYPDFFTFNGHTKALIPVKQNLVVDQNKTVRIFFVTGGPNIGSNFHIIGTIFDRVYTGHPDTLIKDEETVYVAPGSAAVFELTTPVPGEYILVDHALWRAANGAMGILRVNSTMPWPEDVYYPALK